MAVGKLSPAMPWGVKNTSMVKLERVGAFTLFVREEVWEEGIREAGAEGDRAEEEKDRREDIEARARAKDPPLEDLEDKVCWGLFVV